MARRRRKSHLTTRIGRFEQLEDRRLLASVWQNADDTLDVDGSDVISNVDALLIINELNEQGSRLLAAGVEHGVTPRFFDTSGDGWLSPIDALLVFNGLNQPRMAMAVTAHLSPDSDPNGNGVVMGSQITVLGQTLPLAKVTLTAAALEDVAAVAAAESERAAGESTTSAQQMRADEAGRYSFSVTLDASHTTIEVSARGRFGETATMRHVVRRGDAVLDWNAATLNVIRDWTTTSNDPYPNRIVTSQPPMVARNLAMIHAAMADAVTAVEGTHLSILVDREASPDTSSVAAAAAAAHRVASSIYRDADELAIWDATLAETLATVTDEQARTLGVSLGIEIGDAVLALRANDGSAANVTYTPGLQAGDWNRTFPDFLPPLLPQWPQVTPFAMTSGDQFRPEAPPALDSAQYAAAVDEVMQLGRFDSNTRTAEQTEIALFWADGGGTFTPPGHWNQIAADVAMAGGKTLADNAHIMALLNIAMADAGIASWDAKYAYDLWRPIDAIRRGDIDGISATAKDATWTPLIRTPPFPTYTSGHSTFSGAAEAVLTALLGEHVHFASQADGHNGFAQRPLSSNQVVTRTFTSFAAAAEEASRSRIYGGIHFEFDSSAGLAAGRALGRYVIDNFSTGFPTT